jgi:uncharacterized protein YciI
MLFCFTCIDKPNARETRIANRDAHLKYWTDNGRMKIGGPFTSDDGTAMQGSMMVIEAADRAEVETLFASDPYKIADLFERVDIRAWKWVIGNN